MPRFSKASKSKLATCDQKLQDLFNEVIKYYDCTIICGHRGKEDQNKAFAEGKSKLKFPKSKHNKLPSKAVDVAPYIRGISWDPRQSLHFAGFVYGVAKMMGIDVRCGADWDSDTDVNDQTFNDLVHFEVK